MILTIHNLARTYKLLPSEVLSGASTFDLYVLDSFSRYTKYQEAKAKGKVPTVPTKKMPSQSEMMAMLNHARQAGPMKRKGATNDKC